MGWPPYSAELEGSRLKCWHLVIIHIYPLGDLGVGGLAVCTLFLAGRAWRSGCDSL
jgi:hypothetical protein